MAGHGGAGGGRAAFQSGHRTGMGAGWHQPEPRHDVPHPEPHPIQHFDRPCPPHVRTEFFIEGGPGFMAYPAYGMPVVAEVSFGRRGGVVVEGAPGMIVAGHGPAVMGGGGYGEPGYGPPPQGRNNDAASIADAANAVNKESALSHLTFHMKRDGLAEAVAEGRHGFLWHEDSKLKEVNAEAISRGEPDFVQNLLGGKDSAFRFDGKHVVITGVPSQDDVTAFTKNAAAIGEAVNGNYEKAHDMYDAIQRGNVLTTKGPDQTLSNGQTPSDPSAQPAKIDPNSKYNEVVLEGDNKYHLINPDGSYGAAVDLNNDKTKYAFLSTDNQYHLLNKDGTLGGTVPADNVTHDAPAAAASQTTEKPAPAETKRAAATPEQPEHPAQADTGAAADLNSIRLMHQKLLVAEAQEILNKHAHGHLVIDGQDTLKNGKESLTDKALEAALGHSLKGSSMSLADLAELEKKYQITDAERTSMLDDASRRTHTQNIDQDAGAAAMVDYLKKAQHFVAQQKSDGSDGQTAENTGFHNLVDKDTALYDSKKKAGAADAPQTPSADPALRDAVLRSQDANSVKLVLTDLQHIEDGSSVSSKPVKPAPQQNANLIQI